MRSMFDTFPVVMTVKEMCSALRIGRNAAYTLLGSRKIRSFRVGKSIKIPKKCIEEYIDGVVNAEVGNDP